MIIKLILIGLFSNFFTGYPEEEIDFNPRLLQKEVYSIFNNTNFQKIEIQVGNSKINDSRINGKFFEFMDHNGEKILAYIGRVNSCRSGGCSIPSVSGYDLQYEYFDYFIIFDTLRKVKVVRVFNYEATHGQEVIIKRWLDQFAGYDGTKPLRVGKEIDSISGATISVNTLVADVKEKTLILSNTRDFN